MKILIIHSYYLIRGGEDGVFEQELELLRKEHKVFAFTISNRSGLCGAIQFFLSLWNANVGIKLNKAISEFRPDVIHIHNLHFALGPIVIYIAKKFRIPVVYTLHNFRLLCPSISLQHRGKLFTESLFVDFPWEAVKKKVYRNSFTQTFWLAFIVWFHKKIGTWAKVDKYITFTDFSKDLFLNSSLKLRPSQIAIKPNFVQDLGFHRTSREDHFLFIGRLMEEKGLDTLIEAFKNSTYKLIIAGSGPLESDVIKATELYGNISYIGNLNKEQVCFALQKCSALIFPSIWYEGMPLTILEAFSFGTPVIASDIGSMKTMIQNLKNGLHFSSGSVSHLRSSISTWSDLPEEEKLNYGLQARDTYERNYTPFSSYKLLLAIYCEVINGNN